MLEANLAEFIGCITKSNNRPDPVHCFHEQEAVFVSHDGAFGEAHAQTFNNMSRLKLIAGSGLLVKGNDLTAIHFTRIVFDSSSGLVKPAGEPDPALVTADFGLCG